jgi:DNA repair exonuclease SbcCD ATPase subunit
MIPLKIRLKNICQYADFTHEYSPGITGVTGPNGNGKSNFLDPAHYFALTGKAVPGRTKSELLRWGTTSGFTQFTLLHDNITYTLERNVHNSGVNMSWVNALGEKEELTKLAEVDARMVDILGMPFEVFRETCFVPQGKFLDVVDAPHAERMAYFAKISGAAKAETLRGILQTNLNKMPAYPNRTAELQGLDLVIEDNTKALQECNTKVEDLSLLIGSATEEVKEAKTKLLLPLESVHLGNVQRAQEACTKAKKDKADALQKAQIVDVPSAPPVPADETATYSIHIKLPALKSAYEEAVQAYTLAVQKEPKSVAEADDKGLKELQAWLADNKAAYSLALNKVCPTCKREYTFTSDPDVLIKEYTEKNKAYTSLYTQVEGQKTAHKAYTSAYTLWSTNVTKLGCARDTAKQTYDNSLAVAQDFDLPGYTQKVQAYNAYAAYVTKSAGIRKQLETLDTAIGKAEGQLQAVQVEKFITQEEADRCNTLVMGMQSLEEQWNQLKSEKKEIETRLTLYKQQLITYRKEQDLYESTLSNRVLLETCRDILHREQLPKLVMRRMLVALNSRISFFLEQFKTAYTAQLNDDFDFMCSFRNGQKDKPAKSLSGGQKVALALAFRLALSDVMGSAMPMLILDEPTVFLDDDNVESVRDVLYEAKKYTEKGSYILIATHEAALYTAFSQIVETQGEA